MSHEQARALDRTTSLRGELRPARDESAGRTQAAATATLERVASPTDGHPAAPLIARQFARCVVAPLTQKDLAAMRQHGCVLPPAVEGPEAATLRAKAAWITRRENGSPGSDPLVRPDGSLRPDAYTVDEETGCWVWNYSCRANDSVPQAMRTVDGRNRIVNVRRHVYAQHSGACPPHISPACGTRRCINPAHQTADINYATLPAETIARMQHLRPTHTASEIAAICGCSRAAVAKHSEAPAARVSWSDTARYWRGRPLPPQPRTVSAHHWTIFRRHISGENARTIGDDLGVSRQRISQIVHRVDDLLRALEGEPV